MGMSLVMYGIRDSNSIQTENDLEEQIESNLDTSVNLYKIYTDLAMVLTNNVEPFDMTDSMGFKAVMGIAGKGQLEIGWRGVVGFLTNNQASEVLDWLKSLNINSEDTFLEFYDKLDEEVKETLSDYGSEKDELFEGYLKPLLEFYNMVVQEKKAIIFCVE
jgi:hypothetical protein